MNATEIHHIDDVSWHDAPKPRRWHRCRVQTWGYLDYFTLIERCACGAIRRDNGRWLERNSRSAYPDNFQHVTTIKTTPGAPEDAPAPET